MAHTPGPWKVSHDDHEPYWNIDMPYTDGSGRYGYCNAMVYTTEEDARLVASAPELLAALRLIADDLNAMDLDTNGWREWDAPSVDQVIAGALRRANLAITKAEWRDE